MAVKYYAVRFIDRLRPGDEIEESDYIAEHLAAMVKLGTVRREEDEPQPPAPKAKKAAAKKSASK